MKALQTKMGWLVSLVASAVLVGCGGSSSHNSNGGDHDTSTEAKVVITTNAKAIAYKSKNGEWESIDTNSGTSASDGLKAYTITRDDRFMVALKCSDNESYLFGFSKEDGNIKYKCPKLTILPNATISGTLDDTITTAPSGFYTAVGTEFSADFTAPYDYSYTKKSGTYDLIAVSFDSGSNPARFSLDREIDLSQNMTRNVSMDATNSCAIKGKNFNAGSDFRLVYISKENTYFTSSLNNKWYYPDCTEDPDDMFVLIGKNTAGNKVSLKTAPVNTFPKADINPQDVAHINPLTQLSYQNSGQISGLGQYTPAANSPQLSVFIIEVKKAPKKYILILSKKYLEDDNVFDIPKLSSISGFSGMWDGDKATSVEAQALMSDTHVGKILQGKMILLHEIYTFATRDCAMEFATQHVK